MPSSPQRPTLDPAALHPAVWRGAQLAGAYARCIDTGHPALSAELPGGGWPQGALTELLVPQPGIGEIQALRPALATLGQRRVVLLQPPHAPQGIAYANWGLPTSALLWVRADKAADALWSAEQILRSGPGALLFWQGTIRPEALRRLHLAAQAGEALFFMIRPLSARDNASPAPLRLAIEPTRVGVRIAIVKRRGTPTANAIELLLDRPLKTTKPISAVPSQHAPVDRAIPALPIARRVPAHLAS